MTKIRVRQLTDEVLQKELTAFERKYGMSSADFYHKYEAGEMGDSQDMVAWASYYYMSLIPAGKPSPGKSSKVKA